MLLEQGRRNGFSVESLNTVSDACGRISSTRIREALAAGDLATARCCLGRDYSVSGRVEYGHKRGRTIGFPTMNVGLARRKSPVRGVFCRSRGRAGGRAGGWGGECRQPSHAAGG